MAGVNLNRAKQLLRVVEVVVAALHADVGEAASVVEEGLRRTLESRRRIQVVSERMTPTLSVCPKLTLRRTRFHAEGIGTRGLRSVPLMAPVQPNSARAAATMARQAIGMTDRSAVLATIPILSRKVTFMIDIQTN